MMELHEMPLPRGLLTKRILSEHKKNPNRTLDEIALATQCCRDTVGNVLRRYKLNARYRLHWTEEMKSCLRNGIMTGKNVAQLCREVGVSSHAIARQLLKMLRERL